MCKHRQDVRFNLDGAVGSLTHTHGAQSVALGGAIAVTITISPPPTP